LRIRTGSFTLGIHKVDDSFILEDVDFLNARNGVDPQSLQCALQPLVICCGGLVHRFFLPEKTTMLSLSKP
jgi:hypothetical protein